MVFNLVFISLFISTVVLMIVSGLAQEVMKGVEWNRYRVCKFLFVSMIRAIIALVSFAVLFFVFLYVMLLVGANLLGNIDSEVMRYVLGLIALVIEIFAIYMLFMQYPKVRYKVDEIDLKVKEWIKR